GRRLAVRATRPGRPRPCAGRPGRDRVRRSRRVRRPDPLRPAQRRDRHLRQHELLDRTAGHALTAPTALNQLYGAVPQVVRTDPNHPVYGDDIGDVKCYYDADTDRFFVSAFRMRLQASGAFPTDHSHVMLAVSTSGDPRGAWNVYDLDTTNGDGSLPNHAICPCVADQPLIGADHFGFYISTNEYSLVPFGGRFDGAQLYAFDKAQLAAGGGGT